MNRICEKCLCLRMTGWGLGIVLILSEGLWAEPSHHPEPVRMGVAQSVIDLPARVPLAGYSRRKGRASKGLHDPIGIRVLIVQDSDTTAALVSCDLLIIDETLFEALRRRLAATQLPKDIQVILAATHTHSGPGAYGKRFLEKLSMGHFDREVFDRIVSQITQTMDRAYDNRRAVRMVYTTGKVPALVANRMIPESLVDDEAVIVAFYPADALQKKAIIVEGFSMERPLAVVVGFSAHPTTLGAWNFWLSADYPGVVMRQIERQLPGTIGLFFAGNVGDQAPIKQGIGFEHAEWYGQTLAQEVLLRLRDPAIAPRPKDVSDTAVQSRLGGQAADPIGADLPVPQVHPVELSIDDSRFSIEQRVSNRKSKIDNRKFQGVGVPVPQVHPVGLHTTAVSARSVFAIQEQMSLPPARLRLGNISLPAWLGRRLVDEDATLSMLAIDDTLFLGVPCDMTASLGAALKQAARAKGFHPFLIGFANDYIGYCVPAEVYHAQAYESAMAFNGPHAGELLVKRLIRMMDRR